MKSWAGRPCPLCLHMIATIVNNVVDTLKKGRYMLFGYPLFRVVGVVIITIKWHHIGTNKFVIGSVIALIFSKNSIARESLYRHLLICKFNFVGVNTILLIPPAIGCINNHILIFFHVVSP